MEVKCPNCSSRFNLPDAVAKPGAKLRCSVCKDIFRLDDPAHVSAPAPAASDKAPGTAPLAEKGGSLDFGETLDAVESGGGKRKLVILVLVMLLFAGGGTAGWWYYKQRGVASAEKDAPVSLESKVRMLTMRNLRQYYVKNERIGKDEKGGKIFVIEGQVVNEFPTPKEMIEVEAVLYDKDKKPLLAKTQLAGTSLSQFQLQVLGEKELESILNNTVEVLTKNTNIPTGGDVPFMLVFYDPPSVAEFSVRIVNVRAAEKQQ